MEKRIRILEQDQYLVLPIQVRVQKAKFFLFIDDKPQMEFNIPIGIKAKNGYLYDFLSYLPVRQFCGKEIIISGDFTDDYMDLIHTVGKNENHRENRPLLHFTPDYGWMNDPNGLVYQNGLYHMYFQYNPFNTEWDNMSWGHAVSEDLLHWKQIDSVLFPDEDGFIFSGCGLVNEFCLFGLPKDALLFCYSAAGNSNELSTGKKFVQKLAYSLDGGMTLIKKQTVLPTMCSENRDPKIFWHEETKAYIMCLWMENNEFSIYRSTDFEHWNLSQRLTLEKGFECPDLFKLPVEQNEESSREDKSNWVFWCAYGFYYIGTFDGYGFHTNGIRKEAYRTSIPYAAQTISNTGNRIISIPWLRTETVDNQYTGTMGLPREFSLITEKGELKLRQRLVKELIERQSLIIKKYQEINQKVTRLKWESKGVLKIDLKMEKGRQKQSTGFHGCILGIDVMYMPKFRMLKVEAQELALDDYLSDICIIIDKGIVEITANNDIIYAVFEIDKKIESRKIELYCEEIEELKIFEIL